MFLNLQYWRKTFFHRMIDCFMKNRGHQQVELTEGDGTNKFELLISINIPSTVSFTCNYVLFFFLTK